MNTYMMQKTIQLFMIAIIAAGVGACSFSSDGANKGSNFASFENPLEVSTLFEIASDLADNEVAVTGLVSWVCERSASSFFVTDGEGFIRINASEEIPYFDEGLYGKKVIVKGMLKMQAIDEAWLERAETYAHANPDRHDERQVHCNSYLPNLHTMQAWIEENDQDFFPSYSLEVRQVDVLN